LAEAKHQAQYQRISTEDMHYRAYVRPIIPVVDVEYACRTRAFGPLVSAASSRLQALEKVALQNFECFVSRHLDRAPSYGMLHYGDYITPLGSDNGGNPDRPHWRDHEWEYCSALFTRFLRTGDRRAYRLGVDAYRHYMDVDVHYTKSFNFYHSYGDRGEMHEKYYGPGDGHVVLTGLMDAYLLTGDRRALEVARWLCDYHVRRFNEGEETIRKLLRGQVRSVPWPALGMIRMYEITGEKQYAEAVSKAVDLLLREPELMRLSKGTWQCTLVSAFLENYHRATGDPRARRLFLQNVNWHLDQYYHPDLRAFGDRGGKSNYHYGRDYLAGGPTLMGMACPLGYAYELTGDLRYLEIAYQILDEGMRRASEGWSSSQSPAGRRGYHAGATRSDGKWFSLLNFYTIRLPSAFRDLTPQQLEQVKTATPQWERQPNR
jgi:hypothetical protein